MKQRNERSPQAYTKTIRSKKRVVAERFFRATKFLYYLFYWENNLIQTSRYVVRRESLPEAFDGLRIVQVSDLHGKSFGRDNRVLMKKIRAESPDLVVVTGDVVDERCPYPAFARKTIEQLVEIAPTFFVTGNHEGQFVDALRQETLDAIAAGGATILDDKLVQLDRDAEGRVVAIPPSENDERQGPLLAGLPDPESILPSNIPDKTQRFEKTRELINDRLEKLLPAKEQRRSRVTILLSHRPEHIATYASHEVDLVFAGHAHGGQFRIPYLLPNGLNAPHQGFFPRFTSGKYEFSNGKILKQTKRDILPAKRATEIVSRGLGPSVIPTRLFNRPDLVVCVLRQLSSK